ncbi:MAG: hypothetical protein WCX46_02775 [Candidatus Paceibacterota bacterium]
MDNKTNAKQIINNATLIIKDINSLSLLRSELLSNFEKIKNKNSNEFGQGQFLALTGQFAVINFLAKVNLILDSGFKKFTKKEDIVKWKEIKDNIKNKPEYKLFKEYFEKGKPHLYQTNEMDAFVKLILDYPVDLGFKNNNNNIKKVWGDIRNQITHMVRLGQGNVVINGVTPNFTYSEAKDLNSKNIKYSFDLMGIEHSLELKNKLIKNKVSSTREIYQMTSSRIYTDYLNIAINNICIWLCEKIDKDEFDSKNIENLIYWFNARDASN